MTPRLLVVFVDALGPEQGEMLAAQGLALPHRAEVRGVLGYSSGAIPTILTGVPPAEHGRMCLFSAAAEGQQSPLTPLRWLGLLPKIVHERGVVRRAAARAIASLHDMSGYIALHRVPPDVFAQLDLPERDDLFLSRDIGGKETFLGRAREAGLNVIVSDWRMREEDRIRGIEERPNADLAFLYLSGLDAILHRDGSLGDSAKSWARQAAGWISRAQRALSAGGRDVRTLVVGDHGMARVTKTIDPRPTLTMLRKLVAGHFLFVDSTMLRVSFPDAVAQEVRAILSTLPGQVLDGESLQAQGAPNDGRYGKMILLLPEGSIFVPSFVGGAVMGMHGYDRASPSARAAVLSDGALPETMTSLEDIAPWVVSFLELGGGSK